MGNYLSSYACLPARLSLKSAVTSDAQIQEFRKMLEADAGRSKIDDEKYVAEVN
jgi:hypothetical protein